MRLRRSTPTSATTWSRSRPSAVSRKARVVDELELPRDDGVLAREALGERADDAAGVAVGQPRRRLRVGRALVARVEAAAEVGPGRAGGRRPGSAASHTIVPSGVDVEVGRRRGSGGTRRRRGRAPGRCPARSRRRRAGTAACSGRKTNSSRVDAAGERADEVVDEDAVRLGGEAHAARSQRERHDEVERIVGCSTSCTSSSIRDHVARRVVRRVTSQRSTFSMRGSCPSASSTWSLIRLRVRSTFGWPISSWCREPYSGWPSGASSPLLGLQPVDEQLLGGGHAADDGEVAWRAGRRPERSSGRRPPSSPPGRRS